MDAKRKSLPAAIERPVSRNTFGADPSRLAVPEPVRVGSPSRMDRPPLQRAATPKSKDEFEDARTIFTGGMFSDPPAERRWGSKVFTEGHRRLIFLLREEASRLYAYNQDLRDKNQTLARKERLSEITEMVLKTEVRALQEKLNEQGDELLQAQEALAEMDALMAKAQSKRLSRVASSRHYDLDHEIEITHAS